MQRIPYYRKKATRYAKGVAKRAGQVALSAAKERYGTFTDPKLANIWKDVMMLKSVINSEKKRIRIASASQQAVSQVNANASGHWALDVTPQPAQGITMSTRNGASIKLHSSYMKFQFYQQTANVHPMRLKLYIIEVRGDPIPAATAAGEFFAANQWIAAQNSFIAIRDYNSQRNPDYFRDYRVLAQKGFTLKADNYNGQTMIKDIVVKLKYNRGKGHHVRFDSDTTTVTQGQLVAFIVADSGNQNGSTGSTLNGIPIAAVLTGATFNYDLQHYFYDN